MWVLLELVSLGACVVLVCIAVYAQQKQSAPSGVHDGDVDEPDWWPEFEREFALYVSRTEATQRDAHRDVSPRRHDR